MQITISPGAMSKLERDAVIKFINNYPYDTIRLEIESALQNELLTDRKIPFCKPFSEILDEAFNPSPEAAFGATASTMSLQPGGSIHSSIPDAAFGTTLQNSVNETLRQNDIEAASKLVGVDIDKNGFPWDARIHSSNKAKTSDGTWRKRRGIADATVTTVEAELRAVMGAPAAIVPSESVIVENFTVTLDAPLPPPVTTLGYVAPPPPVTETMPPIPASLVRPQVPVAPTPPSDGARNAYVSLIGRTSAAVHQKKITQEQVTACCLKYGVPALPLLANRLDLVPQVAAEIDAIVAGA